MGTVDEFMAEARRRLEGGVDEHKLDAVGRLLAEAARDPGFIPDADLTSLHGSDSAATLLQSDTDGLTLMLARFSEKAETPVHDHNSWGVACVVEGVDRYRHWSADDAGHVRVLYEKELRAGSFVTWNDPPGDIHSQQGVGGEAVELVLFGRNVMKIPRHYYDPATGEVRTALP
jgi:predicted metal-dependent enzyme (double-stranded beta helix superfamily)